VSNYYLGIPIDDDEVAAVQTAAEKIGIDVLNTRFAFDFDCIPMTLQFCLKGCKKWPRLLHTSGCFRWQNKAVRRAWNRFEVWRQGQVKSRIRWLFCRPLQGQWGIERGAPGCFRTRVFITHVYFGRAQAKKYVANENQTNMIEAYIKSCALFVYFVLCTLIFILQVCHWFHWGS
jgi:hypothetical protein